jgi:hypothetical protein
MPQDLGPPGEVVNQSHCVPKRFFVLRESTDQIVSPAVFSFTVHIGRADNAPAQPVRIHGLLEGI